MAKELATWITRKSSLPPNHRGGGALILPRPRLEQLCELFRFREDTLVQSSKFACLCSQGTHICRQAILNLGNPLFSYFQNIAIEYLNFKHTQVYFRKFVPLKSVRGPYILPYMST